MSRFFKNIDNDDHTKGDEPLPIFNGGEIPSTFHTPHPPERYYVRPSKGKEDDMIMPKLPINTSPTFPPGLVLGNPQIPPLTLPKPKMHNKMHDKE